MLALVVRPILDAGRRVLLLALDGMGVAAATELAESIAAAGPWLELTPGGGPRTGVLAADPPGPPRGQPSIGFRECWGPWSPSGYYVGSRRPQDCGRRRMQRQRLTDHKVVLADGRRLAVEISGAPHGSPVFLLHGTPGSRNGPKPRSGILYRLGIRLISYDRPGYGGSSRAPARRVADAAHDVGAIADQIGLDRFSVVGRSGGGPHALACAALLPHRVVSAAVLVGLAPSNAAGLNWFAGMADTNVREYSTADVDDRVLVERLRVRAERTTRNPESLLELVRSQMAEQDRRVVESVAFRRLLVQTYAEALRGGPYGWIDDILAFRKEWGFALEAITSPVLLWHGKDDTFSPLGHTWWLASRISDAEVQVQRDTAHFGAVEVLPRILAWLTS